jgi:hypothetical protein
VIPQIAHGRRRRALKKPPTLLGRLIRGEPSMLLEESDRGQSNLRVVAAMNDPLHYARTDATCALRQMPERRMRHPERLM